MPKQKCTLARYSAFLARAQTRFSAVEMSKQSDDMAHDAVWRWLRYPDYTPPELWRHVSPLVNRTSGYLICDDTTLDKSYSRENDIARPLYSGNMHGLVNGINLVNILWTEGDSYLPIDYRVYRREYDGKTRNDHFQDMLRKAHKRGFTPQYVLMDSWYGSVENLKDIRTYGWHWICNLKSNRKVSLSKGTYIPVSDLDFTNEPVQRVWLKEYGHILVCISVATNGDTTYLSTSDLALTDHDLFTGHWNRRWDIEVFHRGMKQTTGIEKCYATTARCQLTHIFASFVTFISFEKQRQATGVSWYEQKLALTRCALSA